MHTQKPWDCVVYAVASNPPMIRAQAPSKTIICKKQGASTKASNSLPLLLHELPPENMERLSILGFRSGNKYQLTTALCIQFASKKLLPLNRCCQIA